MAGNEDHEETKTEFQSERLATALKFWGHVNAVHKIHFIFLVFLRVKLLNKVPKDQYQKDSKKISTLHTYFNKQLLQFKEKDFKRNM